MLTKLLIHLFVRERKNPASPVARLQFGMLAGIVGIAVNILLTVVKMSIGFLSGSVSVAADAVNNLSDAGASVVTVIGFKLAARPADNGHPFGHGRLEYIAGVVVAVIIMACGLDFLHNSVMRIISPVAVQVNWVLVSVLASTVLFKLWLFFFYRCVGRKINSQVIEANAVDSLSDILSTLVVIGTFIASRYTEFPVDGCVGVIMALWVLFCGVRVLKSVTDPLLGEVPDSELVEQLQEKLLQCDGIKGVHDIILHNYGPHQYFATAHAEVSRDNNIHDVHDMLENAEVRIARELPVRLLLHCDPYDTTDPYVQEWRVKLENCVCEYDPKFKVYDFHFDESGGVRVLHFNLLVPRNYFAGYDEITAALTAKMRVYDPQLTLKIDFRNSFV